MQCYPKVGAVLTFLPDCPGSGQILMIFKIYLKVFFLGEKKLEQINQVAFFSKRTGYYSLFIHSTGLSIFNV